MSDPQSGNPEECDHEYHMGSCKLCGAECPDGCDNGTHSQDCYSYGRNEGHYTREQPCECCNPKYTEDDPDAARADYELDARKDRDWGKP